MTLEAVMYYRIGDEVLSKGVFVKKLKDTIRFAIARDNQGRLFPSVKVVDESSGWMK